MYIYSGVCYNEQFLPIKSGCYNERGGILSVEVARACACRVRLVFTRERLFMLLMCVRLFMVFIMESVFIVCNKESVFIVCNKESVFIVCNKESVFIVCNKERLFMLFTFTCTVYKSYIN
jgi:hypothetical protein